MSTKLKIVLATLICVAGMLLLARAYVRSTPPPTPKRVVEKPSPTVEQELDPARFSVRIKRDDLEAQLPPVLDQIRASIIEQATGISQVRSLGAPAVNDLADAFIERLRFMLDPDAQRDYPSWSSRGDGRSFEQWSQLFANIIENKKKQTWTPGMDPGGVEVTLVRANDEGRADNRAARFGDGFGITTGRGPPIEILPENPIGAGMLVVEIVLPMERMDVIKKKPGRAILGYHLAWNPRLGRWVVYESVLYRGPDGVFSPPIL